MAHPGSDGEVVDVRVGSKMIGGVWWRTVKRKAASEGESVKLVTKMLRRRHLQTRRGTVELLDETSTAIEHWSGRISVAGHEFDCEREKRRGKGSAAGFIGEWAHCRRGKQAWHQLPGITVGFERLPCWFVGLAGELPLMASAITRTVKKEGEGRG